MTKPDLLSEDQGTMNTTCPVRNCLYELHGHSLGELVLAAIKHYQEKHQF